MGMSVPSSKGSGGRRGRRRGGKHAMMSEINVTPFVDVMLVLLIIFMVSAPLLVNGIPLNLPKTVAGPVNASTQPLTVSIDKDGRLGVNTEYYETAEQVIAKLQAQTKGNTDASKERIFFRAADSVSYQQVSALLASLQNAGFGNIVLASEQKIQK